jgi:hypothetical protein
MLKRKEKSMSDLEVMPSDADDRDDEVFRTGVEAVIEALDPAERAAIVRRLEARHQRELDWLKWRADMGDGISGSESRRSNRAAASAMAARAEHDRLFKVEADIAASMAAKVGAGPSGS